MADTPTASGADLARMALAAARAAAKNRPAEGPRRTRRTTRPARGEGRDPLGLGSVLERLTAEQGWTDSLGGGNLIDQWPQICPTALATTVQPVAYDADRGILTLRPSSPAYATQLRLFQPQLAKHLNTQLGRTAVRGIRILAPGAPRTAAAAEDETAADPQPQTAEQPRQPAPEGYQEARELLLAHRPDRGPTDPHLAYAVARQDRAIRNPANREPADQFTDGVAEAERVAEPVLDRSEAVRRAALARKRAEAAGTAEPRRLFGAA